MRNQLTAAVLGFVCLLGGCSCGDSGSSATFRGRLSSAYTVADNSVAGKVFGFFSSPLYAEGETTTTDKIWVIPYASAWNATDRWLAQKVEFDINADGTFEIDLGAIPSRVKKMVVVLVDTAAPKKDRVKAVLGIRSTDGEALTNIPVSREDVDVGEVSSPVELVAETQATTTDVADALGTDAQTLDLQAAFGNCINVIRSAITNEGTGAFVNWYYGWHVIPLLSSDTFTSGGTVSLPFATAQRSFSLTMGRDYSSVATEFPYAAAAADQIEFSLKAPASTTFVMYRSVATDGKTLIDPMELNEMRSSMLYGKKMGEPASPYWSVFSMGAAIVSFRIVPASESQFRCGHSGDGVWASIDVKTPNGFGEGYWTLNMIDWRSGSGVYHELVSVDLGYSRTVNNKGLPYITPKVEFVEGSGSFQAYISFWRLDASGNYTIQIPGSQLDTLITDYYGGNIIFRLSYPSTTTGRVIDEYSVIIRSGASIAGNSFVVSSAAFQIETPGAPTMSQTITSLKMVSVIARTIAMSSVYGYWEWRLEEVSF